VNKCYVMECSELVWFRIGTNTECL
jgi:hypothetical protein